MDASFRHESKFIKKIVEVIGNKVSRHKNTKIVPYLVGIDSRVESINLWIEDSSIEASILAVCGMGGIGKTTIAKIVFNLNFGRFEGSSFLGNIREISDQPNGIIYLQRKFLSDIVKGKKRKVDNVDEGIVKIKDAISCKRILVILDDVDKAEQLDALLGTQDLFYPGSKIIITTRNVGLIKMHEACKIYNVQEMDSDESLELFSWHAFGQDHPIEAYLKHSRRVVKHCGGLPLALQVLGSSLSRKSVDVWESALRKLETLPDYQIQKKLKISYDSLEDDHDKNLFLDISCFFVGKDKDYVIKILDECNFYSAVGIQNLVDRGLVVVGEDNKLMMHQLLQDMGREIIRQESPKEPGGRSRLWDYEDSFHVLREKTGTETIEGLVLDMHTMKEDKFSRAVLSSNNSKGPQHGECMDKLLLVGQQKSPKQHNFCSVVLKRSSEVNLDTDVFTRMHRLRLLQINYVRLTGGYDKFPKKLRSLCWRGFHLSSLPSDLPLENLVNLDMQNSRLKQVWRGTKFLGLIKILDLSHSHDLVRTPNFSGLPNLENLILEDCICLIEVHESIENSTGLILLNLKDCRRLRKLPRSIAMLKHLEKLVISGCSNLRNLPMDMKKMESLQAFKADGIVLDPLHNTIGDGRSWNTFLCQSKSTKARELSWPSLPHFLVSLSLVDCNLSDSNFPSDFSNMPLLQKLNLSKNPICSLPNCIKGLSRIDKLELCWCTRLKTLIELPITNYLNLRYCTSLEKVTFQSTPCPSNCFRYLYRCEKLVEMQGSFKFESLPNIDAEMINNLGWYDLDSTGSIDVKLYNPSTATEKNGPIQALFGPDILSIFFPGNKIPRWFENKIMGASISLTVCSPLYFKIHGLNLCSVYAINQREWIHGVQLYALISNRTKNQKFLYCPACYGIPELDKDMMWLCHLKLQNEVEAGDELDVTLLTMRGIRIKEVGIQLVYDKQEAKGIQSNTEGVIQEAHPCMWVNIAEKYFDLRGTGFPLEMAQPMFSFSNPTFGLVLPSAPFAWMLPSRAEASAAHLYNLGDSPVQLDDLLKLVHDLIDLLKALK